VLVRELRQLAATANALRRPLSASLVLYAIIATAINLGKVMSGFIDSLNHNQGALLVILTTVVAWATLRYARLTSELVHETARMRAAETEPNLEVYTVPHDRYVLVVSERDSEESQECNFRVLLTSEDNHGERIRSRRGGKATTAGEAVCRISAARARASEFVAEIEGQRLRQISRRRKKKAKREVASATRSTCDGSPRWRNASSIGAEVGRALPIRLDEEAIGRVAT